MRKSLFGLTWSMAALLAVGCGSGASAQEVDYEKEMIIYIIKPCFGEVFREKVYRELKKAGQKTTKEEINEKFTNDVVMDIFKEAPDYEETINSQLKPALEFMGNSLHGLSKNQRLERYEFGKNICIKAGAISSR